MIDFKQAIINGQEKAASCKHNIDEIKSMFIALDDQLFSHGIRLYLDSSFGGSLKMVSIANPSVCRTIGRWKQHIDGYPFTLDYSDSISFCETTLELKTAIIKMVSSGSFWLEAKSILN